VNIIIERIAGLRVYHAIPDVRLSPLPLVFTTGVWVKPEALMAFQKALAERGYESYILIPCGHRDGVPVADLGKVTISNYAEDIEMLVNAIGKPVILVPWSMSVIPASKVAERNHLVKGFISMTSAPPRGVLISIGTMALMPKYLWKMLTGKAFMPSKTDAAKWMFNTMSGKRLEECLKLLCRDSGTVCWEIASWKHSFHPLPCPTLVIGAKYDRFTPNQRAVAKKFGTKDFEEVPCCHALICDENYMSVVAVIDAWISKKFRSVEE